MAEQIGLSDFIKQVKAELLTPPDDKDEIPLLSVDSIELELQVAITKDNGGTMGFNLTVLTGNATDKEQEQHLQKVRVTLSPLLTKNEMRNAYLKKYPEKKDIFIDIQTKGGLKGNGEGVGVKD